MAVHALFAEEWAQRAQPETAMRNNIRNGGPIFSGQNNGLHVLNQRLQNEEQYQKMAGHALFAVQWAQQAQPETALREIISNYG